MWLARGIAEGCHILPVLDKARQQVKFAEGVEGGATFANEANFMSITPADHCTLAPTSQHFPKKVLRGLKLPNRNLFVQPVEKC